MAPFTWSFRVRYHECDPQGIVFNAHWLAYFDMTMVELLRDALGENAYRDLPDTHRVDFVVGEATVRFRAPARFDERLTLEARVERLGNTAMTTTLRALRAGELLVEGELRHVFVDAKTWRKTPIPAAIRAALEPYATAA
ncbi:MAG: acyl-CoA thioesterase [Solirubrobacteraceae bacterium]|nr:acyl-CoA thioesterase [Solirubrobacteraceae bacterium]